MAKRKARASYQIFFSHSHKDRWVAKQCVRLIEEASAGRVNVFLDEKDIDIGQRIAESIRRSIEQCDEFILLLSPYSKGREWILIELGAAWGMQKPIVIIIDKIEMEKLPDIANAYKAVDLNDFDQYLSQLLKRVQSKKL